MHLKHNSLTLWILATVAVCPSLTMAASNAHDTATPSQLEQCMQSKVLKADAEQTVAALRAECMAETQASSDEASTPLNALDRREASERRTQLNPFVITAHRPSYIMPITYNSTPNSELLDYESSRFETKFQLSFKMPLWIDAFDSNIDLYFAYTGQSYWQIFKEANSRPFRETNHEPEVFVEYDLDWSYRDYELAYVRLGFVHQSNGRDIPQSRSWNRVYLSASFAWDNWFLQVKPWYRFQEDARTDPNDPDGDDNPNIERFVGQAEVALAYRWTNHTLSAVWRNNFRSDNRGSIELGYSYPINDRLRGYVQYFNGYGENLLDYDESSNRIGIGVLLTDWL